MRPLTPWGLAVRQKLTERRITIADLARAIGAKDGKYISEMTYGSRTGARKYRAKINEYLGLDA